MTRKYWIELGPAGVLGFGIIVSTMVAVWEADSSWLIGFGPLLMAFSIVGADVLGSRLRGESPRPSSGALLVAAAFLVACGIAAFRGPTLIAMLIPILGGGSSTVILSKGRSRSCGRIPIQ